MAKAGSKSTKVTAKPTVKANAKTSGKGKVVKAEGSLKASAAPPKKLDESKAAKAKELKLKEPKIKEPKAPKVPKVKVEKKSKATLAAEKAHSDDAKKWSDLRAKHSGEKAQSYTMSGVFEEGRPLLHKVLGWGFITQIQNDRLEVLFESGSKILISNYKP